MTLADRIEGLDGPSREVDAEIACAIGLNIGRSKGAPNDSRLPAYTASMDAVRTFIDPSDEWEVSTMYNIARATVGLNRDHQTSWPGHGEHAGCDPVLALLAAALRAQEAEGRGR